MLQRRASAFQGDSYVTRKYREWFSQIDDAMTQQLEAGEATGRTIPQSLFAGTPEECIQEIEWFAKEFHITDVIVSGWGTSAGDDPSPIAHNLERFARIADQPALRPKESGWTGVSIACTTGRTFSANKRRLFSAFSRGMPP